MNRKTWKDYCNTSKSLIDFSFYNKAKKFQKSLIYNSDPNAVVIHHLRDTEEQRKYNDEHYELWGFNEDGTFEYGKYVIFVTKEEHTNIHRHSEETKKKISEANKGKYVSEDTRKKMSEAWKGHVVSEETRKKISENRKGKYSGERNHNYRKALSEETRKKISENRKGKYSGNDHWLYGKHLSDDIKKKISDTHKQIMTDELREKISKATKEAMSTEEVKQKMSESHRGIYPSDEARAKMSASQKARWTDEERKIRSEQYSGENSSWYGRHHTDESRAKMSEAHKQLWDDEKRLSYTGSGNPFYGKHHTKETMEKIKRTKKEKRDMFEAVQNKLSDITWKLFLSYYSEYKKELSKTPSLEEIYNYILSKMANV